ncbi:uracil phosphoribosyltransferase-domain-containing protein [Immersiella caudata]|uniref:Uracil phosphoribosyltransferase-domain-containing protein n=1 Tax=Immersiella caudata TaxID=314043 RepID=A0AA40BZQ9_9PEZI|nr:uracil phosphoribosyltransferase-domain-containing protein [Immersiella caudata]
MAPSDEKPIVVGIYGVPGTGKSFLLRELKKRDTAGHLVIFEGSETIASVTPGGLEAFKTLPESEKTRYRQLAIAKIQQRAAEEAKVALVAGHLLFWSEEEGPGTPVMTQDDMEVYTHMIYLHALPATVAERRKKDITRSRPPLSVSHIERWQRDEAVELQRICEQNSILFIGLQYLASDVTITKVERLLAAFRKRARDHLLAAEHKLDTIVMDQQRYKSLEKILVFDGDKTLAAQDTGKLFWNLAYSPATPVANSDPLKKLFGGPMGYREPAFRQAALLYTEMANPVSEGNDGFNLLCDATALEVTLRPEMLLLLHRAVGSPNTAAIVVTCGLQRIWESTLKRVGLSDQVKVIGASHAYDASAIVVTPETKSHIVRHLRNDYQLTVWAFGDGVVDIPMMIAANHAIVVVGGPSQSMEEGLKVALYQQDPPLRNARQALCLDQSTKSRAIPRLNTKDIPAVDLTSNEFLDEVFQDARTGGTDNTDNTDNGHGDRIHHATALAASKILATAQRDARISGHALRTAHQRAGWYLSMTFISDIIGAEEIPEGIPHVQGSMTTGHRLRSEKNTLIVALMRGGEPMALGVSEAFPSAGFLHAKVATDLSKKHLEGVETVMLVDSVVNSGKTVVEFVQRVRHVGGKGVRIVVVAGVVQAGAVDREAEFGAMVEGDKTLDIVALRLSENQFTGRGGTDTGNRLFNTTRLE